MYQFPKNFFWGSATSAYQVEGSNSNCDWWQWEKGRGLESSGEACRHYQLYAQDFDLARQLNHNAHRLSVEWSRVQPQEGEFSARELKHYAEVIAALRERGLEPIVTLHHFTNPLWFVRAGGWSQRQGVEYFLRYVETTVEALASKVTYWVTINEPLVYLYHSYILGVWPPQKKSFFAAKLVEECLLAAHIKSYRLIHDIYRKRNLPAPKVSIAKNMQFFTPCNPSRRNRLAAALRNKFFNFSFLERLIKERALDFIGLNYYTRSLIDLEGWGVRNILLDTCKNNHSRLKQNSLGWDIYPDGLYHLLLALKKYNLAVFILENGICTDDDSLRWDFIRQHLVRLHQAISEGVEVSGYLYWSLLDNFEWDKGFAPRFGLIEVDYSTYQRKVRESARKFSSVCQSNQLI